MNNGLYIVATEPVIGYERLAECCVKMNVPMLQLRDKRMNDRQLLQTARMIRSITKGSKTAFVVNDRADIAYLSNADYLHIGLSDISVEDARRIVGDMKIGISAETISEAMTVNEMDVDYIGIGPIFETPTKQVPQPPLGVDNLRAVLPRLSKPVVAIGGIFPSSILQLYRMGVSGWAMVRQFMSASSEVELETRIKECDVF